MALQPRKVAVVDDNAEVRTAITSALSERGWSVQSFPTLTTAVHELALNPPDLLIVDVELPDGCGLNLIPIIGCHDKRKTPAIAISDRADEDDVMRSFAAGAVDFMSKPFGMQELVARCRVQLSRLSDVEHDARTPNVPLYGGLAFGRYRIIREIGRGGYGVVYMAQDVERQRLVALKVCMPKEDVDGDQVQGRFIRESYALRDVTSPNVVELLDVGSGNGKLYYAMEYVVGTSLHDFVQRNGTLSERQARQVMLGLLEALCVIEAAGIVHRDIKPSNVLLRGDDFNCPVLIDFGLAKQVQDRDLTASSGSFLMGTPSYIAPEVIRGADPTNKSDLWSLGVTIRWVMTGEDLFPGQQGYELLRSVETVPATLPNTPMSPGFTRLMASLIKHVPDERVPSAAVAIALLRAVCATEGASDSRLPASAVSRAKKSTDPKKPGI